jgi:cellobiose epimerase
MNLEPKSPFVPNRQHGLEARVTAVGKGSAQLAMICCLLAAASIVLCTGVANAQEVTRDEVEHALRQGLLEVWFPRILDKENGGFLCDFDYDWKPAGRQPKSIVFQARSTWLAARAAERYPQDPRYREAARHGFQFLKGPMWDAERGGWYWKLDRQGKVTAESGDVKHAYGISFGLYACAAYAHATKDPQALDLAKSGFLWLDRHGHDAKSGGYFEFFTRDGTPILTRDQNPLHGDRDSIGTHVGYKSMNTHIHLLESFTALLAVWPDPTLKARTNELHALVRDRIVAPPGAMHQFFNPDWTPVPDHDSFGHDIETAYLLLESAEALGMKDDPKTVATAKSLLDHGLDYAWDKQNGGFFETGGAFGPVYDKSKGWWTQAEGMNALLIMSMRFPDDPRRYRKLFDRQWAYVKKNVMDAEHGEWYPTALDAGGNAKAAKASEWKAGYHAGRALLNAAEWLGEAPR